MAEVDDGELSTLQRGFKLLQALNGNPESRRRLEESIKVLDPNLKTTDERVGELLAPQFDEIKTLREELKAERTAAADANKAREAAEEAARYESAFTRLRQTEGVTAEGEEEVRKLMVERKIADPEAAYALMVRHNPPVDTTAPSYVPQSWNFEDATVAHDIDGLWKNPERWTDRMIPQVLADERKPPARI